jgi:hypothetical protein
MARRLRLSSGLILFAYVVTHFLNHSFVTLSRRKTSGRAGIFPSTGAGALSSGAAIAAIERRE